MLPDIQDRVRLPRNRIDAVGIAGVRYPTTFDDGELEQSGIATFDVTVRLPPTSAEPT